MLQEVKELLGNNIKLTDAQLNFLLNQATEEAISYTHNPEALSLYKSAIIQMTIWKANRLSTEGLQSEQYSGVSYSYTSDYPEAIYNMLRSYRKVRTL